MCFTWVQNVGADIRAKQPDVDRFSDLAQVLAQTSNDSRLTSYASQATNRYRALRVAEKVHMLLIEKVREKIYVIIVS